MGRALIILNNQAARNTVVDWACKAPEGTRVEFKHSKRTLPQNDRMWAMLTDVSVQAKHSGQRFRPETWKLLFMEACGKDMQSVPTLDGKGLLPLGRSSADLSIDEMNDLMSFMEAWGAENGIKFNEPEKDTL